jgi:hypothetical protein
MTAPSPGRLSSEPEVQRSSCEIKTSTRGADITVKAYAGSPLQPAVDEAIAEYQRAVREMEAWQAGRRAA